VDDLSVGHHDSDGAELDDAVVSELDAPVGTGVYEPRSEAVRRAVDGILARHRRRGIDDAFRAGFATGPMTRRSWPRS
jgi:Arc/MetJ-type ribon-helix-helix transcriptional regulator